MDDKELEAYYVTSEPDINEIKRDYDADVTDLSAYVSQCQDSYNNRNAEWLGKNAQLTKSGDEAFPWAGASDTEVRLIEQCISTYVGMMMNALSRSNIRAYPIESSDVKQAGIISSFLKYMQKTYIRDFKRECEIAANNLLEKGIAITYVDWEMKSRTHEEEFNLELIEEIAPELYDLLADENRDEETIVMMTDMFDYVDVPKAKSALKELRDFGIAKIPVAKKDVSRPFVETKFPDIDIVIPSYVTDLQRSPRVHMRTFLTPQEIENCVETKGWDAGVAGELIEEHRGSDSSGLSQTSFSTLRSSQARGGSTYGMNGMVDSKDLIEVVYTYRRLIDPKSNSEGIYVTIWNPRLTDGYLSNELLSGYDEYPFVFSRISNAGKRLYDVNTFGDLLRGPQKAMKTLRDGWSDQMALAVAPPLLHPVGRAPAQMGAGAWIGVRANDKFEYMNVPNTSGIASQLEKYVQQEAMDLVGLNSSNELSSQRQQFFIDKFLTHCSSILKKAYKAFLVFGPDEKFFRVTGYPNEMVIYKSPEDEEIDICISFDVQNQDPDVMKAKIDAILQLARTSPSNTFNLQAAEQLAVNAIDPSIADMIIQPEGQGQEEMVKNITDDLTKIFAGIPVGARPNGGDIAMQVIQEYTSQEGIQARIQSDPSFATNIQNYAAQYQQQVVQQQNAEIGKLGTAPAQMGSVNTQGMEE
tara:strand:+ start:3299 stop:5389 length:2091 start_codon:yes stop_codon:yes gene_type:complete